MPTHLARAFTGCRWAARYAAVHAADARPVATSWLDAERERAVLWLPVFMGAGVLTYYSLRFEPPVWLGAALTAGCRAGGGAVPARALAARRHGGAGRLRHRFGGLPVRHLARAAAGDRPADPRDGADRRGPLGRSTARRPPDHPGERPARRRARRRCAGPCASGCDATTRHRHRHRRHGAGPRAGPAARSRRPIPARWDLQRDAFYAGLGGSGYALGPAERLARAAPTGLLRRVQRLREAIAAPHRRRHSRRRRRLRRHPADRVPERHSRRRPRRVPRPPAWRICWRSPACISASSWASR